MKEEEWEKLTNCEKLRCKISDLDLSEDTKNDLVFELTNVEDEISELQEENERLYIQLEDRAYEQIKFLYKDYKLKIDKAIEYIDNCFVGEEVPRGDDYVFNEYYYYEPLEKQEARELLNILRGDDEE